MNVQLTPQMATLRKFAAGSAVRQEVAAANSEPTDTVVFSAEASHPAAPRGTTGLRKVGLYATLGLALVMSLGVAGCAANPRPAPEPVRITKQVDPPSPYRQLGREVRAMGQEGKEAAKQVKQEFNKEIHHVKAAAKDFWAGVRGK